MRPRLTARINACNAVIRLHEFDGHDGHVAWLCGVKALLHLRLVVGRLWGAR